MSVNDFYSAEFANNETTKNKERIYNDKLKTIFQQFINRSVEIGKFSVDIPEKYIDEQIIEFLKDLNYNLDYKRTGMNEYSYKVSWG
jgi:hypothetical protein